MEYLILLFYKYTPITDHVELAEQHKLFCQQLDLKGRIIVAPEGINGTLSGLKSNVEHYIQYMHANPIFKDILFKIDPHYEHAFKKLFVRPKPELVTWRLPQRLNPAKVTGKRLTPKEFYHHLQDESVLVLDGRNGYEYDLGHFRGAIRPDVETTREFPEWVKKNLNNFKDRKIITYCTGGIRCEILTSLLIKEGCKDVSQLDGGIVSYAKDPETQGRLFDGKCYVFDERISVPINQFEEIVVGRCFHCQSPTDTYINCLNSVCNRQHLCCERCLQEHNQYCSLECQHSKMAEVG